MPALARPAATPSSNSPAVNSRTTTAASVGAPISTAPSVATDISISMLNGVPAPASRIALAQKNPRPSRAAGSSAHLPTAGAALATTSPPSMRVASVSSRRALPVVHHAGSASVATLSAVSPAPTTRMGATGRISKPRLRIRASMVARGVASSSNRRARVWLWKSSRTPSVPPSRLSAVSIVLAQLGQSMPPTR